MKDASRDDCRDRQHGDHEAAVFPRLRADLAEADHFVTAWSPTFAAR